MEGFHALIQNKKTHYFSGLSQDGKNDEQPLIACKHFSSVHRKAVLLTL